MSTGEKIPWESAAAIAKQLVSDLAPFVRRVKTVGSVRRQRPAVGDIEILIEPLMTTVGLFDEAAADLDAVRVVAQGCGTLVKNGDRFIQVATPAGFSIDLFICMPPAQWGSLLAIRTGPAELGIHAMRCLLDRGLRHVDGHVETREGELVPTPTEEAFFAAAGLPCLPARLRYTTAAFRSLQEAARG